MSESEFRRENEVSLEGKEISFGNILTRRNLSPDRVAFGEIRVSEEVDVALKIDQKDCIVTLHRSFEADDALTGTQIDLQTDFVTLKDSDGNRVDLNEKSRNELLTKADNFIRESKKKV